MNVNRHRASYNMRNLDNSGVMCKIMGVDLDVFRPRDQTKGLSISSPVKYSSESYYLIHFFMIFWLIKRNSKLRRVERRAEIKECLISVGKLAG